MKRLLWVLWLWGLLCVGGIASAAAGDPIGVVVGLQGSATATSSGQARPLALKAPVFMGESIQTSPNTRLQIMFQDDSLFSIGESAEVVLDEFIYKPAQPKENSVLLRILRGVAKIITGKTAELNPEAVTVKTGRATIGIRGCELGFEIAGDRDIIYLVRIPQGRSIRITPSAAQSRLAWARSSDFVEAGLMVEIDEGGRLRERVLNPDDLRRLNSLTQLEPPSARRPQEGESPRAEASEDSEEPLLPTQRNDFSGKKSLLPLPKVADPDSNPIIQDTSLAELELQEPQPPPRPTDDETTDPIIPPDPFRPIPPPPPPALTGGGLGALYDAGTPAQLSRIYLYHADSGKISLDESYVNFIGREFDGSGSFIGYTALSLSQVPINRYGSTTEYEGYQTHTDPNTGAMVTHDNLAQFVRYTMSGPSDHRLTYWGIPSANYSGSQLPADQVDTYDVSVLSYPGIANLPFIDLENGTLRINTHTGAYRVETANGGIFYGSSQTLRFYGQESQGVGFSGIDPTPGPGPHGMALAGFHSTMEPPAPAESGVEQMQGYAWGSSFPAGGGTLFRTYQSADPLQDGFAENEGRVSIQLDKDNTTFQPVAMNLNVFENPSAPSPSTQIQLGNPDMSFYVAGREFGATYDNPNQQVQVTATRSGTDWTWGEWNGEMQTPDGMGGTQNEGVHGEFVAGSTLSAAAFQALAAGGSSYILQTPAGQPGHASGMLMAAGSRIPLQGTCTLQVSIPGGGVTPTWGGNFQLTDPGASSTLNMSVLTTFISPEGHLKGTPAIYALTHGGVTYDQATLVRGDMNGSLVGPGTGPAPVTGAIGSGNFLHNNGYSVNMTYGTDLAP